MTAIVHHHPLDVCLHPHEVVRISAVEPRTDIECQGGILWITCSDDRTRGRSPDVLLRTGEHFAPVGQGCVVIEAMCEAEVTIRQADARGDVNLPHPPKR